MIGLRLLLRKAVKRGGSTLAIGTVRTFSYTGKSKASLEEFGMMVMEEHAFEPISRIVPTPIVRPQPAISATINGDENN